MSASPPITSDNSSSRRLSPIVPGAPPSSPAALVNSAISASGPPLAPFTTEQLRWIQEHPHLPGILSSASTNAHEQVANDQNTEQPSSQSISGPPVIVTPAAENGHVAVTALFVNPIWCQNTKKQTVGDCLMILKRIGIKATKKHIHLVSTHMSSPILSSSGLRFEFELSIPVAKRVSLITPATFVNVQDSPVIYEGKLSDQQVIKCALMRSFGRLKYSDLGRNWSVMYNDAAVKSTSSEGDQETSEARVFGSEAFQDQRSIALTSVIRRFRSRVTTVLNQLDIPVPAWDKSRIAPNEENGEGTQ